MRNTTIRCDRCYMTISEGVSVMGVTVTAGALANRLHEPLDFCPSCSSSFIDWLKTSAQPAKQETIQ